MKRKVMEGILKCGTVERWENLDRMSWQGCGQLENSKVKVTEGLGDKQTQNI